MTNKHISEIMSERNTPDDAQSTNASGRKELRINRLNSIESGVVERVLDSSGYEYHHDGDLVVEDADEEARKELSDECYRRARRLGRRGDYQSAKWAEEAARKVGEGVVDNTETEHTDK